MLALVHAPMSAFMFVRAKMYKTAFWMKKHGGMTWKRTWMWGSSPHIECLDLGPLLPAEKPTEVRTTKTWIDKDGKKRWQGTDQLKGTQ